MRNFSTCTAWHFVGLWKVIVSQDTWNLSSILSCPFLKTRIIVWELLHYVTHGLTENRMTLRQILMFAAYILKIMLTLMMSFPGEYQTNSELIVYSVLWCCQLGDRKGIWSMKTSASRPLGMAVNVSGWDIARSTVWVAPPASFKRIWRVFGLSNEDTQDKNDWRFGATKLPTNRDSCVIMHFHLSWDVCVAVCWSF